MVQKETFKYLSEDKKTKIVAHKWIPDNCKAIVQLTHGMVEYIDRYDEFATYLASNGYLVVGNDHLGHGDSINTSDDLGYFGKCPSDILINDMHRLRSKTQKKGIPYFMLGHSMGSYLLRKYLSIYGKGLSGAIIMGTGYIPGITTSTAKLIARLEILFKGERHRSKLLQKLSYDKYYKKYSLDGSDLSNSWLTKNKKIVKEYYSNPKSTFIFTDNAYLGLFDAVSYSCKYKNINKISKKLPILLISGKDDPVGAMGSGVEKVYKLYKKANLNVDIKLYDNDRHEILNETDRKKVYKDILNWLDKGVK